MKNKKVLAIVIGVIALVFIILSGMMFEDASKSKNYVCQMPVTGNYVVWNDGGLKWQGMGNVNSYSKTSQIEFTELEKNEEGYVSCGDNPAASTTFNDKNV